MLRIYLNYQEQARGEFEQWPLEKKRPEGLQKTLQELPKEQTTAIKKIVRRKLVHYLEFVATSTQPEGPPTMQLAGFVYPKERLQFDELIDKIYEKNREDEDFKDREEVFNLFARATMSGRLLTLVRLIEKTFGKGAFRKLGEKN